MTRLAPRDLRSCRVDVVQLDPPETGWSWECHTCDLDGPAVPDQDQARRSAIGHRRAAARVHRRVRWEPRCAHDPVPWESCEMCTDPPADRYPDLAVT